MELVTRGKLFIFQKPFEPVDLDFKDCCYTNLALADLTDDTDWKNDIYSVFFEKEFSGTTIEYYIIVNGGTPILITDDTFGRYVNFGDYADNPNLSFLEVNWNAILNLTAGVEANIQIRQSITVNGSSYDITSFVFNLKNFSNTLAENTFRWDVEYNGFLHHLNTNLVGTNLKSNLRLNGFFGNRNNEVTDDILINTSDRAKSLSLMQDFIFKIQINQIPNCISKVIIDQFMYAERTFFSDYNSNNHDYDYKRIECLYENHDDHIYNQNRTVTMNYDYKPSNKNNRRTRC